MKRILLTGITGQVGHDLQRSLTPLGELISLGRNQLDFSQPEAVWQTIKSVQPEIIVNSAAYTAVDKAESEPELAKQVNGIAPRILAEGAQELGAGLIHISTDYVFDGCQSTPYLETDQTHPLGVYGESKRMGEEAVQAGCDLHMIVRTAWVYGVGGRGNFVKTMLRLGAEREEVRVVVDQIGSPTWSRDLAGAIAQMIPRLSPETAGTYHYTNSGACSWYDFAIAIFEEASLLGFPLKIQRVVPITTPEYPLPARRPAFSVLSLKKTSTLLGNHPPHWRKSLRQMLAILKAETQ